MPPFLFGLWRRYLKLATAVNIKLYRLTGGKIGGRVGGVPVLLLTTTGRKSGKQRTMPLTYVMDEGRYIVAASFVGFGKKPGWYYNLTHLPKVTIQVKRQKIAVTAILADDAERQRLWGLLIEAQPGYERFAAHSKEPVPVFILRP